MMDMNPQTQNEQTPLNQAKDLLKKSGAQALLVRSTDRYFNEYVPEHLSARAYLSNFTGSVGDALITTSGAHLFVDGRYALQAKSQACGFSVHVCQNNLSIENSWLAFLQSSLRPGQSVLFDPSTLDLNL